MDYLNRCLLLGRYRSITIIDDNVSCLVIVINDDDGDLTIPIITSTDVANKLINSCEDDSLIGIKGKIDANENGLIIRAEKISFLSHKERAINFDSCFIWNILINIELISFFKRYVIANAISFCFIYYWFF